MSKRSQKAVKFDKIFKERKHELMKGESQLELLNKEIKWLEKQLEQVVDDEKHGA
jgi:hypothetical protein